VSSAAGTKSVRWRLFALITFCVAAPIVFLVTYFPATQIAALERALTNKSRSFASMLVGQTKSAIAFDDVETAREAFDAVTVDSDVAMVALHRANGSVLAASNSQDHPAPAWTDVPVITHLEDRVRVVAPVVAAEGPRGLLVLELSTDRVSAEGARIQLTAVLVGLLAILVGGCAAWFVGRSFGQRTDALHASREQFRTLLETTDAVPWEMTAPDWRFTYVGPQASARFCIPKDHWGTPALWQSHVVAEDLDRVIAAFTKASADRAEQEVEFRIRRAEGRDLWVRSLISSGGDTSSLRGFMFDVTKQAELELELRQAQKLESVGRLAAGVAHEINTPVQFVSDSVHFARDSFGDLLKLVRRNGELRAMLPATEAADVIAEMEQAEQDADLEYLSENLPRAMDRAVEGLSRVATIVRSMKEFAHPDARGTASADINSAISSTLVIARAEYKDVAEVFTDLGDLPRVNCRIPGVPEHHRERCPRDRRQGGERPGTHRRDPCHDGVRGHRRGRFHLGHGRRHPRRRRNPHLRPVLHDQSRRSGNGARPRHRAPQHRRGPRRYVDLPDQRR
jgi:PAS domain-containing protein